MPETIICAHRGLDDIAPENTLAAFAPAFEREMAIEFDVRMTADRQLIILHDPTVERATDGFGSISDCSLADARGLDAGSWFRRQFADQRLPTLDEVLNLVGSDQHVSPSIALVVNGSVSRHHRDDLRTSPGAQADRRGCGHWRYHRISRATPTIL